MPRSHGLISEIDDQWHCLLKVFNSLLDGLPHTPVFDFAPKFYQSVFFFKARAKQEGESLELGIGPTLYII